MADRSQSADNIIPKILNVRPLVLEVGTRLIKELKESSFSDRMIRLREKIGLSLGIIFPTISIQENRALLPREIIIKVREVEAVRSQIQGTHAGVWLESELLEIIKRYASEFLGADEVSALIAHMARTQSELVESVYPAFLSLQDIRKVLQNLLHENIPIRDLTKIFEALRDYLPYSRDPDHLTEFVRHALSRVICSLYQERFVIEAFVLNHQIEQLIAGATRSEEGAAYIDLNPETGEKLLTALHKKFHSVSKKFCTPVLIVSPEIRRFVKMLMERLSPDIPVLSGGEISPEYRVKVLGEISLDSRPPILKKILSTFRKNRTEPFPGDNLQKALLILNLIGPAGGQVGQYLNSADREALYNRGIAAPIPNLGKESVISEFLSYLPPEIKTVIDLSKFAGDEPAVIAGVLKKNWLQEILDEREAPLFDGAAGSPGRLETDQKEKAAIFISGAARWVQDEVYRWLSVDELRELGLGMLQFPFISSQGKRKAWEESESTFFKEEWWDPETLSRFLQASLKGTVDEFKKRPFRRSQKLAILLLSLPEKIAYTVGKEVFSSLPKAGLQRVLTEMTQWRDQLPAEIRFMVVSDFLSFVSNSKPSDLIFTEKLLTAEVERMIHRDPKSVSAVLRKIWLSPQDGSMIFGAMAGENPRRIIRLLTSYYFLNSKEIPVSSRKKLGFLVKSIHPEFQSVILSQFSESERKLFVVELPTKAQREKTLSEFLRAYYASAHIPALSRN